MSGNFTEIMQIISSYGINKKKILKLNLCFSIEIGISSSIVNNVSNEKLKTWSVYLTNFNSVNNSREHVLQ